MPLPRTSHTCVPYKNRYLVVIGGENAELEDAEDGVNGANDLANDSKPNSASKNNTHPDAFQKDGTLAKHQAG